MKLLSQTTIYYLLLTLIVFGFGGIMTYQILQEEVDKETGWYLREELVYFMKAIERGSPVETFNNGKIKIEKLPPSVTPRENATFFSDTLLFHPFIKRVELHKKVVMIRQIGYDFYRLTNYGLVIEGDDLYDGIFSSLSKIFGILVLVIVLASFLISKFLFRPFHQTLGAIKKFHLQDPSPIDLQKTHTREFADLNNFLRQMTRKMRTDYQNLKEFTENASHEIQTPLAIAKGKLELLMETPGLHETQVQLINATYRAIHKLSRLGHSLALLARIENQEFGNTKTVNLTNLTQSTIFNFKELAEMKDLKIICDMEEDVLVHIDPILADMLLTNLLQNAIRHNIEGGMINISLNGENFSISNPGPAPALPPDQLFERFRKSNQSDTSVGLGLAIVKKICEVNEWNISYEYQDNMHVISVIF